MFQYNIPHPARFETNKFTNEKSEMILLDIYFVPVVTYLIFSTGDYAGRVLSGIFQWVRICVLICKICIAFMQDISISCFIIPAER